MREWCDNFKLGKSAFIKRDLRLLPLTETEFDADFFFDRESPSKDQERWMGVVIERGFGDLINSHIEYVRAGVSLGEIDELIGTHADYLLELLRIHHLDTSDVGRFDHVVDELSRGLEWLKGLGLNDAERLGLPTPIVDAWNTAWSHVGYAGDLIEQYEGVFNQDIDWSDTITAHVDYVKDLLRLHF